MPFYQLIVHGQMTGVVVLGAALLWLGMFRHRSAVLLAAALLLLSIKPHLLLLPVVLAIRLRMWRALALSAAGGAVAVGAAMLALGPATSWEWLHLAARAATWDEQNGISLYGMFGWNAFLRGLFGVEFPLARTLMTLTLIAATTVLAARTVPELIRRGGHASAFICMLAAMVLASPHFYAHDLLILAVGVLALFLSPGQQERSFGLLAAAVLWVATYLHLDILGATRLNVVVLVLASTVLSGALQCRRQLPARRAFRIPSRVEQL
jgi:hypothetical protein